MGQGIQASERTSRPANQTDSTAVTWQADVLVRWCAHSLGFPLQIPGVRRTATSPYVWGAGSSRANLRSHHLTGDINELDSIAFRRPDLRSRRGFRAGRGRSTLD